MNKIFWAGDSTVAHNSFLSYPQTGIGQAFPIFVKRDVLVENHAMNGRSTKSFMDEGRLAAIEERIGEGDFLFIQFGHNDEKIADPSRYTEPFSTFQENLAQFVETARRHGAWPVLITPLERRCFLPDHTLGQGEHGPYVEGMKQLAQRLSVPLIDLHAKSRRVLTEMGEEQSRQLYMHLEPGKYASHPEGLTDNTHLQYAGAVTYGNCVAQGLKELGGRYAKLLIEGY